MTLKKQLQVLFNNNTVNQNRVNECEKLADDYAMGFANWCMNQPGKVLYVMISPGRHMRRPAKELLKIYKEERGL